MDHSSKPKNIKSLVGLLTEHIEKSQYVIAITRSSRVNNITLLGFNVFLLRDFLSVTVGVIVPLDISSFSYSSRLGFLQVFCH